jgi:fructoselysine 3-epimerase
MKLGMFTSGYQLNRLEDIFRDAKRFGYDYIELWGGRPHAFAPDLKAGDIEEIKRLTKKYDIPILGYTPEHNGYPYNYMIGNERMRTEAVEYLKLSLEMAKEMGADFMLMSAGHAGYYATYEEIWDRLAVSLREITDFAEELDMKLVLETLTPYESNVVKSANDLLEVFRRVPSSNLYGMCDVVAPFVQNESILDYLDKLGDKIHHMHIVDSDGSSATHFMPGDGQLPLKELLEELKERRYDGTVTIELVTAYINEPSLYARRAINRFRELLG